jgi:hypothetical protein
MGWGWGGMASVAEVQRRLGRSDILQTPTLTGTVLASQDRS